MRSIVAVPLLLAASAWAAPSAEDFFAQLGIDHVPSRNGDKVKQTIEKTINGKAVKLDYNVEHHPNLVHLDNVDSLTQVQCHSDKLYLSFSSAAAAKEASERLSSDAVVGGSRSWGCVREDGTPVSILRKVHSSVLYDETTLYLGTVAASFEHAFRNAQISFTTAAFPQNYFKTVHMAPKSAEEHISRRDVESDDFDIIANPVVSFFQRTWNNLSGTLSRATKSLQAIFKSIIALKDGTGVISQTFYHDLANWNYDHATGHAVNPITPDPKLPWFVCEDCFANADLEIEFVLEITDYKVNRLRLTAGGVTRFNALTNANFQGKFSKEWVVRIAEVRAPPIIFDIAGVPFVIDLIVPIDLEFDLMADVAGRVTASANAHGYIRFGFDYRGNWDNAWIVEKDLAYGATSPTLQLTSPPTVGLSVALFPNLHVKLDHIGGVAFGLRVIGTTALQVGCGDNLIAQDAADANAVNALMSIDVGAQGVLGAFVDVKVLKKSVLKLETKPLEVLAYERRVALECVPIIKSN